METFDESSSQEAQPQEPRKRGKSCLVTVLIVAAVAVLLCAGVCGGFIVFGVRKIKDTEAYQMALTSVQQSPEVIERLGEPIKEASWVPSAQINISNGQGSATMDFDVEGPQGRAHVRSQARLVGDTWGLTLLEVTFADGERTTLDTGGRGDEEAPKWEPPEVDSGADQPGDDGEAPQIDIELPLELQAP